jgi:hypothetical protein
MFQTLQLISNFILKINYSKPTLKIHQNPDEYTPSRKIYTFIFKAFPMVFADLST